MFLIDIIHGSISHHHLHNFKILKQRICWRPDIARPKFGRLIDWLIDWPGLTRTSRRTRARLLRSWRAKAWSRQGCIKFPPQTPGPQAIKSPSLSVGFGKDNQVALAMAKKIKWYIAQQRNMEKEGLLTSVADPFHFDMDPDPRIRFVK